MTYLQALVGVAQAQLPAGHHGLPGAPRLSTDQTPALRAVSVWAQHLHTALVSSASSWESDLCRAEEVREQSRALQIHEGRDKNSVLICDKMRWCQPKD